MPRSWRLSPARSWCRPSWLAVCSAPASAGWSARAAGARRSCRCCRSRRATCGRATRTWSWTPPRPPSSPTSTARPGGSTTRPCAPANWAGPRAGSPGSSRVGRDDFFVFVGRLLPHKQSLLGIPAAGVRLVLAGDGPGTTFVGRVSDDDLRSPLSRCRALLMPDIEDLGTASGGALDSVRPGVTGTLVDLPAEGLHSENGVRDWARALRDSEPTALYDTTIRTHVETFSRAVFDVRMASIMHNVLSG